jgi:hypothetical protein
MFQSSQLALAQVHSRIVSARIEKMGRLIGKSFLKFLKALEAEDGSLEDWRTDGIQRKGILTHVVKNLRNRRFAFHKHSVLPKNPEVKYKQITSSFSAKKRCPGFVPDTPY